MKQKSAKMTKKKETPQKTINVASLRQKEGKKGINMNKVNTSLLL